MNSTNSMPMILILIKILISIFIIVYLSCLFKNFFHFIEKKLELKYIYQYLNKLVFIKTFESINLINKFQRSFDL
jgi:hypothetical protein